MSDVIIHVNEQETGDEVKKTSTTNSKRIWLIAAYIVTNCVIIYLLFQHLCKSMDLRMIYNLEDLKHNHKQLTSEKAENLQLCSVALFSLLYIFLQALCIPGSMFMNLLAGGLFGVLPGTLLCCVLTALGSCLSYWFFQLIGRDFLVTKFASMTSATETALASQTNSQLFLYMLSARLFPFTPNWLLNLACSLVNVDLTLFFVSTLVGLLPYHWVTVKAGLVLSELNSTSDILRGNSLFLLFLMSFVLILNRVNAKWTKKE